jgi:hypothetical protein
MLLLTGIPLDVQYLRGRRTARSPCQVVRDPRQLLMVHGDHLYDASFHAWEGARVSNEAFFFCVCVYCCSARPSTVLRTYVSPPTA